MCKLNDFLGNGARFYIDRGQHPEYATPECLYMRELIACEKAGEKILAMIREIVEKKMRIEYDNHSLNLTILKNNTDAFNHSYGCHENYLIYKETLTQVQGLLSPLTPFLVARQIVAGTGCALSSKPYFISQKSQYIERFVNSTTTNSRPIINLRSISEPLADVFKYHRLHLILGDSNMSEYAMYLKVGLTSMILEIMEDQYEPLWNINLSLLDPVEALHEISQDPSCTIKVLLRNGDALNAVEILEKYAQIMEKYYFHDKQERLTDEKKDIYEKFVYVIACLKKNPALLYGKLDWITKKIVIEQSLKKYGSTWENYRDKMVVINGEETPLSDHVQTIDLQYHNIDESNSIYYLLERKGHMERIVSDEEIKLAMTEPPEGTRAKIRGKFIKKYHNEPHAHVNWDYIRYSSPLSLVPYEKSLIDPFTNEN